MAGFTRVTKIGLLLLLLVLPQIGYTLSGAVLDRGNVNRFYGIPVNLTVSELKRLPYHAEISHEYVDGAMYTNAIVNAENGVQLNVSFDSKGKFFTAETSSREAVDPEGIKVGSSLSDVRGAWPAGRLIYGIEENSAFVNYITGTNVMLVFDPRDLPQDLLLRHNRTICVPNIKVRRIRISATPVSVPETCVPGYCL